eukprot:SAG11_NODE_4162_length_2030_cov_2.937338_1_plen_133_part_00
MDAQGGLGNSSRPMKFTHYFISYTSSQTLPLDLMYSLVHNNTQLEIAGISELVLPVGYSKPAEVPFLSKNSDFVDLPLVSETEEHEEAESELKMTPAGAQGGLGRVAWAGTSLVSNCCLVRLEHPLRSFAKA